MNTCFTKCIKMSCVTDERSVEESSRQLEALFKYSVTGDSAYLLATQRQLMDAQDEDGDTSVDMETFQLFDLKCQLQ